MGKLAFLKARLSEAMAVLVVEVECREQFVCLTTYWFVEDFDRLPYLRMLCEKRINNIMLSPFSHKLFGNTRDIGDYESEGVSLSASLRDKLIRPSSSISIILTGTTSPMLTTSCTLFTREIVDPFNRFLAVVFVLRRNEDLPRFFNINFNVVFLGNFVDCFSSRPNNQADFFRIDLNRENFWSPLGKLRPGFGDLFGNNLVNDMMPDAFGFSQRLFENLFGNSHKIYIQFNSGDEFFPF